MFHCIDVHADDDAAHIEEMVSSNTASNVTDQADLTIITDSCGSTVEECDSVDKDIVVAVLEAFKLAEEMNCSQKHFLSLIEYGKKLYCTNKSEEISKKWPTTLLACMKVLKEAGYVEPQAFYVCLDTTHPTLWNVMPSIHDKCKYCSKTGTIPFYYLSIEDKIRRWCSSEDFCYKMLAHWHDQNTWLHSSHNPTPLKEIWHGQQFKRLSWFWDPEKEWLLPTRCNFCKLVVSSDVISSFLSKNSNEVECPHCYHKFVHQPQYTKGDPRNIALIGHWDGWQPFSTSIKHSCGNEIN